MTVKEIYESNDGNSLPDEVLNKFINAYHSKGSFYSKVVRMNSKNEEYLTKEKDRRKFSEFLFAKYKESVLTQKPENVEDSRHLIFAEYLKKDPMITYKEFMDSDLDSRYISKEDMETLASLKRSIKEFDPNFRGNNDYWHQIEAPLINFKKGINYSDVRHRIYIHADDKVTYPLYEEFINKCMERNIPFLFKYPKYREELKIPFLPNVSLKKGTFDRDDSTVIYSDEKHFSDFIDILREIKKEHPEFMPHIGEPPILSQKIDGWMGYGSEPEEYVSFNDTRATIIHEAIDEWDKSLKSNINLWRQVKDTEKSYQSFLINEMAKLGTEKLLSQNLTPDLRKAAASEKYKNRLINEFNSFIGELIRLNKCKEELLNHTASIIGKTNEEALEIVDKKLWQLNIRLRLEGKTFGEVNSSELLKEAQKIELTDEDIVRIDPSFLNDLRKIIKSKFTKQGIDDKNIAFATYISKDFKSDKDKMFEGSTNTEIYEPHKKSY